MLTGASPTVLARFKEGAICQRLKNKNLWDYGKGKKTNKLHDKQSILDVRCSDQKKKKKKHDMTRHDTIEEQHTGFDQCAATQKS